jgi:hypothetical protein
MAAAISGARRQALSEVWAEWSDADQAALTDLLRRFADDLIAAADRMR